MANLVAYPIIEELQYRQNIDSVQLNRMFRSLEESVLRCILRSAELNQSYTKLNLGVNASYRALSHQITQLDYKNISGAYATAFETVRGGHQDQMTGIVTLDWNSNKKYSKIPRYDVDGDGISETVSPGVTILLNGDPKPIEDDIYKILSKKIDSYWVQQITEEDAKEDQTLEIRLPPSLNKKFNYIEVTPFPIFGIHIKKIEYFDIYSNAQTLFDSELKQYKFYNNSGPIILHVSPKEFNNTIKITFRADETLGVIGFSNIDIALIDYVDTPTTIIMGYENIPLTTTSLNVSSVDLDMYVDSDNPSSFITDARLIDLDDPTSISHYIPLSLGSFPKVLNKSITLTAGRIGLQLTFKENFMTTPVIRGSKLLYS